MAKMKQDEIRTAVESMLADAEGFETDELSNLRKEALDFSMVSTFVPAENTRR